MPEPFAHHWPGKYDGEAVTLCSGERFALVDLAPLTFMWRPAPPCPEGPFVDPATEPAPAGNHPR